MQPAPIVLSALWPVLINTAEGVRGVAPLRLDVAAVLLGVERLLLGRQRPEPTS